MFTNGSPHDAPSDQARGNASFCFDAPPPSGFGVQRMFKSDGRRTQNSAASGSRAKAYGGYSYVSDSDGEYDKSVVKSAHRALQVFEFFAEYRQPANATQIAANLETPQSSASMLLRSLVALGYLHYDVETRLYSPALRFSLLGAWQQEHANVASQIIAVLKDIHDETGECVMLAEQHRHFVRYIHVLQSDDPHRVYYVPLGTLRPICTTAFGHILLAQMPEKRARELVHRGRSDGVSADFGVNIDSVMTAVAAARERGHSATSRAVEEFRSYQIAALVPQRCGAPPLAMGICGYGSEFLARRDRLIERLRFGARALAASL